MPTGHYERYPGLNDGLGPSERRCSKCVTIKPVSAFSPDRRSRPDGRQSICKACRKQREADWRNAHPGEAQRRANEQYRRHKERKDAYGKLWSKRNPGKRRAYSLKQRYGLTPEQYAAMLSDQGNACAICERSFESRPKAPHTDHDHATGRIRGILCGGCNITLGHMEKPGFVAKALAYLAAHVGTQIGRSDLNATFSTSSAPESIVTMTP